MEILNVNIIPMLLDILNLILDKEALMNNYKNNDHIDKWTELNKFVEKLSDEDQQKLYQELKRSGSVENPIKYTETHLEGGIESVMEDENDDKINSDG